MATKDEEERKQAASVTINTNTAAGRAAAERYAAAGNSFTTSSGNTYLSGNKVSGSGKDSGAYISGAKTPTTIYTPSSTPASYKAITSDGAYGYDIGSGKGLDFVANAAAGQTMTGGDGSAWTKNADGSTTITAGGKTYTVNPSAGGVKAVSDTGAYGYTVSSGKGLDFIRNAQAGQKMTGSDGSFWTKNADGTTTIVSGNQRYVYNPNQTTESLPSGVTKTQYMDVHTGEWKPAYNIGGKTYLDAAGTTAIPNNSMVIAGDGQYYFKGQNGKSYSLDQWNQMMDGKGTDSPYWDELGAALFGRNPENYQVTDDQQQAQLAAIAQDFAQAQQQAAGLPGSGVAGTGAAGTGATGNGLNLPAVNSSLVLPSVQNTALNLPAVNGNLNLPTVDSAALNLPQVNGAAYQAPTVNYTSDGRSLADRYADELAAITQSMPQREFTYDSAPTYVDSYAGRIEAAMNKILNRDPFAYDSETDPLYQNYRDQYLREGRRAMEDAYGNTVMRTGGLGSTWAQSAAQQARNYYASQTADKIPELYQIAYNQYLKELENQFNDVNMLRNASNYAYGRYQNQLSQWNADRSFAYNQYLNDLEADRYANELAWNRATYGDETDYNRARAAEQENYNRQLAQNQQEYQRQVDAYNRAYAESQANYARQTDAWDRAMQEAQAQYNRESDAYNRALAENQVEYGRNVDAYNRALTENQTNYARDVDAYNRALGENNTLYARGIDQYNMQRQAEQDAWQRTLDQYNMGRQNALDMYNQNVDAYNMQRQAAQDAYNRNVDAYNMARQAALDEYNQSRQAYQDDYNSRMDYYNLTRQEQADAQKQLLDQANYWASMGDYSLLNQMYGYTPPVVNTPSYVATSGTTQTQSQSQSYDASNVGNVAKGLATDLHKWYGGSSYPTQESIVKKVQQEYKAGALNGDEVLYILSGFGLA